MKSVKEMLDQYLLCNVDLTQESEADRDSRRNLVIELINHYPVEAMELDLFLRNSQLFPAALVYMNEYHAFRHAGPTSYPHITKTKLSNQAKLALQRFVMWIQNGSTVAVYDSSTEHVEVEPDPMQVLVTWKERRVYPWIEIDMEGEQIVGVNKVGELIQMLMMEPNVSDVRVQKIKDC